MTSLARLFWLQGIREPLICDFLIALDARACECTGILFLLVQVPGALGIKNLLDPTNFEVDLIFQDASDS